jgi:hypothetical protein
LKLAGACIGGYSTAVCANTVTLCCTRTKRQNSRPKKGVAVTPGRVVRELGAERRRPLERILPIVHDRRHVGRRLLAGPVTGLLVELNLKSSMLIAPSAGPPK